MRAATGREDALGPWDFRGRLNSIELNGPLISGGSTKGFGLEREPQLGPNSIMKRCALGTL